MNIYSTDKQVRFILHSRRVILYLADGGISEDKLRGAERRIIGRSASSTHAADS